MRVIPKNRNNFGNFGTTTMVRCDYAPCGRIFHRKPSGEHHSHEFCSPQCAAKNKTKRAAVE